MMRFTRIYLLYVVVFAWMNFPSNANAAACSFPLTQTVGQSCDDLRATGDGSIYNAGSILNIIYNQGSINQLTNTASGLITGSTAINNNEGSIGQLNNSGNIQSNSLVGIGISNSVSINSIVNNNTGIITGGQYGIFNSFGTINSISNSGQITSTNNLIANYAITNTARIISLVNESGGLISGTSIGIFNSGVVGGLIDTLTNNGTINGIANSAGSTINNLVNNSGGVIGSREIQNSGAIGSITNYGSITVGIQNSGTISSLYNKQGSWNGGALTYAGAVPGSYYALISSRTNYGQIAFNNPTGTMNFNIASGSTVQKGTYANIMTGISSPNISNKSGVFDGLSWKLTQNNTGGWDLIFGYLGVSIKNTTASFYSNQQSINSFLHQRYAVMAVVLNYDCANFDKYGVCISFQSRATGFGNQSTGAGVLTASHKITDKIHVGAFLDYQVNQVMPGGPSIGPGGVQSGFNNATFGGFASYYANPNKIGLQARIAGAYNPGKVTVTRPLLENTEAGTGTTGLNGSGVYGEIGWGLGLAKSVIATPFVGIRGIDITRKGYSESYTAAVQYPILYNSYFERVLTSIAGGQVKTALTDRLNFQAGVWAELDVRRSANSYSGWSTIPGLETFSLAHGGAANRLRPAGYVGLSYEVSKNQRITTNTVVREQAYSDRTNVTSLVGYQFSF